MAMLETVRNSLRLPGLRNRLLFTLAMLLVFRLGAHIPVPGIRVDVVRDLFGTGGFLGLIDLFSGGAFRTFSIFAMSITPYINSSIIMQLLTIVIPRLEELSKEGEEGRKKINEYVRYGTIILGTVQAFGLSVTIRNAGALVDPSWPSVAVIVITLTAGTAFLMWLGEQITEKGIGNGISLLIFAGIVSQVPAAIIGLVSLTQAGTITFFHMIIIGILAIVIVAFTVLVLEGVRKIPVQYAKRVVGRRVYGGQTTHIPMKINQAGVIPVIFAQSLLLFPMTIASFLPYSQFAFYVNKYLNTGGALYWTLFAAFIIFFTYFYVAIQFNPVQIADNIKKNGGFIPGLRPGKPTSDYLAHVSERITLVGALFLAGISVLPILIITMTGVQQAYLGGTALLIVVGVALETMRQIEAHLVMRHYQGFMRD
jgi:preprotein translocase subunit SecY